MKIAIATSGEDQEAPFAPHFGWAANFIIFDTITKEWDVFANPAFKAKSNLGVRAAQFLANHDVQVVISGNREQFPPAPLLGCATSDPAERIK